MDLLGTLAANNGVSPEAMAAEAFGFTLVAIPAKSARRFREIETACDLETGAVLESLIDGHAEQWWGGGANSELLEAWITEGWDLEDEATALANLGRLRGQWDREDDAK